MSDTDKPTAGISTLADGEISRLVLARVLLREAERFVDHDTPALQSLALLPLQDAVELVLPVVGTAHRASYEVAFDNYLNSVQKAVGRPLLLRDRMIALKEGEGSSLPRCPSGPADPPLVAEVATLDQEARPSLPVRLLVPRATSRPLALKAGALRHHGFDPRQLHQLQQ